MSQGHRNQDQMLRRAYEKLASYRSEAPFDSFESATAIIAPSERKYNEQSPVASMTINDVNVDLYCSDDTPMIIYALRPNGISEDEFAQRAVPIELDLHAAIQQSGKNTDRLVSGDYVRERENPDYRTLRYHLVNSGAQTREECTKATENAAVAVMIRMMMEQHESQHGTPGDDTSVTDVATHQPKKATEL